MADDEAGPTGPQIKDNRADWLSQRVCTFLKVKDDAFQKLLGTDGGCAPLWGVSRNAHCFLVAVGVSASTP